VQGDGVPRWLSQERAESERFARIVEDPSAAKGDQDFAAELGLTSSLRELGRSGSPDAETRRRIRAGIVERLGRTDEQAEEPVARHALSGLLVAAAAVLVAVGGLGMLLSKDALPGDPLYGVKLAGESAALGLTFGQQAKAEKYLEFANNRLDELAQLKDSGRDSSAYLTGLAGFDSNARAGVAQLTTLATESGNPQQLTDLRNWARERATKLAAEGPAIPSAATGRFAAAQSLLAAIEARATALTDRMWCYTITSGSTDELGALPAQGGCDQRPAPRAGSPSTGATPSEAPPTPIPAQTGLPRSTVSSTAGTTAQPTPPLPPATGVAPPSVINPPILSPPAPYVTATASCLDPAPDIGITTDRGSLRSGAAGTYELRGRYAVHGHPVDPGREVDSAPWRRCACHCGVAKIKVRSLNDSPNWLVRLRPTLPSRWRSPRRTNRHPRLPRRI
jgi:hypothetical protein